jgi:excisionase family DNA binding protein
MNITFNEVPEAISQLIERLDSIEKLLTENGSITKTEPDQLLTIQQAGELLNLSVPTLYGYVQRAEIPVSKRGKRLYFSKQELFVWIKEGRRKTLAESSLEAKAITKKKNR